MALQLVTLGSWECKGGKERKNKIENQGGNGVTKLRASKSLFLILEFEVLCIKSLKTQTFISSLHLLLCSRMLLTQELSDLWFGKLFSQMNLWLLLYLLQDLSGKQY